MKRLRGRLRKPSPLGTTVAALLVLAVYLYLADRLGREARRLEGEIARREREATTLGDELAEGYLRAADLRATLGRLRDPV